MKINQPEAVVRTYPTAVNSSWYLLTNCIKIIIQVCQNFTSLQLYFDSAKSRHSLVKALSTERQRPHNPKRNLKFNSSLLASSWQEANKKQDKMQTAWHKDAKLLEYIWMCVWGVTCITVKDCKEKRGSQSIMQVQQNPNSIAGQLSDDSG